MYRADIIEDMPVDAASDLPHCHPPNTRKPCRDFPSRPPSPCCSLRPWPFPAVRPRRLSNTSRPPAVERGKTTRVTFIGAHLDQPLDLWTSLLAGKVQATPVAGAGDEGHAVFDVKATDDAPVGICGLRLATVGGLSNAHLFLIDDLPVRQAPPSAKGPERTPLPAALWGAFREAEVDRFAIDVTAGQHVSFEAVANRFGTDVDPLVTIRNARGAIVAEHDNDPGLYFDCRFEHVFKDAGMYTVEVRDSRFHGSEHWMYVLRMGRFPAARHGAADDGAAG